MSKKLKRSKEVITAQGWLLTTKEGYLNVRATDLDTFLDVTLEAETKAGYSAILDPAELKYLLKCDTNELLKLSTYERTEGETQVTYLRIEGAEDYTECQTMDPDDYPTAPEAEYKPAVFFGPELIQTLKHTRPITSTDELRPHFCGVYIEPSETGYTATATDAQRLITLPISAEGAMASQDTQPFIMPNLTADLLMGHKAQDVIVFNGYEPEKVTKYLRYEYESNGFQCTITHRIIDQKYPAYRGVIPTDNPIHITFTGIATMLKSIKKAELINEKVLAIDAGAEAIHLESTNKDTKKSYKAVLQGRANSDLKIGFNLYFLSEMIKHPLINSNDQITLECSSPQKAAVITLPEGGIYLLMPAKYENI